VPKLIPQGMKVKAVSRLEDALKVISGTER
jgi:hypothetical protein